MTHVNEREILEAALLGYQSQIGELQNKMREIEVRLNPEAETEIPAWFALPKPKRRGVVNVYHDPDFPDSPVVKRRKFSAEARAAMSAAAKKRWRLLKRAA